MAKQISQSVPKSSRTLYFIGLAAVAVAIGVHFYLTLHHFSLKYGIGVSDSICNISTRFSCTAASLSKFSELLGVPMALWGAVTNAALLVWALMYPITEDRKKPASRTGILLLAGFIALVSVVMALISLTQLSQLCPFCIVTYILSFTALLCLWKGLPTPVAASKSPFSAGSGLPIKNLALTAVGIFLVTFIVNTGVKKNYSPDSAGFEAQLNAYVQEWSASAPSTINPIEPVTKGNTDPNAKFTLIEFADFRCGHCKHAAPTLDAFVKAHPDVRLIFQTYPLDGECNSDIPQSNGASCLLARAFVCASRSNKAWEAHDWLYENQEKMADVEAVRTELANLASAIGLDANQLKTCADSDEIRKVIESQAQQGHNLGIKGTPTIYANNRVLPAGQALGVLQKAYDTANAK